MSQRRTRKAPSEVRPGVRSSVSMARPAGDYPTAQANQPYRTPRSVRYELENALLGLCDVWFQDIKPQLLRNNVKVHVHKGGDLGCLLQGAPGCSHLEPGAASDSPLRRSCSPKRLRMRRSKVCSSLPTSPSCKSWKVPRLCNTYNRLSPPVSPKTCLLRAYRTQSKSQSRNMNTVQFVSPCIKPKMKNKSTHTEVQYLEPVPQNQHRLPLGSRRAASVAPVSSRRSNQLRVPPIAQSSALFSDELIDIISREHKNRQIVLRQCPETKDYPLMNLQSCKNQHMRREVQKKSVWR